MRPGDAARTRFDAAYRAASYHVRAPEPFAFEIDRESLHLARLQRQRGVESSAFVTAHNPGSQRLSSRENARRHAGLLRELAAAGRAVIDAVACDPQGTWPDEASLFVPGLSHAAARSLGRRWGQNAVVVIGRDAIPRIEWLS